jgi:endogenous inhibitor of DNA gyrase (YacG/DUF329 family)
MSSAAAMPPCPICGKPAQASHAPFCSRRCADIDLGRWLKGGYAIPGRPDEGASEDAASPPDGNETPDR